MRLLLSGYYGFGNLGDEAILAGLARALTERGHEVTVLSNDPVATAQQHGVAAAHRTRGVIGALLRCDALVSGGGGLLQDLTSTRSLTYYLAIIRLARLLGKRVAVYGQSLGPLSEEGKRRVARALRGIPAFWRDQPSRKLASQLGLMNRQAADAALLLTSGEPSGPDPVGPVLLVPRAGHPDYNRALLDLAAALLAEGRRVAAIAMHAGPDDAEVGALVRTTPGVEALIARSPEQLLKALTNTSFVVSARLHGCILAAAVGVPFAALSYDPKVAGFAEQLGAPVFHAPVEVDQLFNAVVDVTPLEETRLGHLIAGAQHGIREMLVALGE